MWWASAMVAPTLCSIIRRATLVVSISTTRVSIRSTCSCASALNAEVVMKNAFSGSDTPKATHETLDGRPALA